MDEWVARPLAGPLAVPDAELDTEFEARLRETGTLAFRVAFGVLRHRQDAEDVAQEAFARAHKSFRTLRDPERFRGWLVRMTWRLAIDRQRSDRRRLLREHAVSVAETVVDAEHVAVTLERRAQVWAAIDALPERLRLVVVLAGIKEHSTREVSRLLDIAEGTVKSRLFAARRQLAERLQWMIANSKTR
jgi:RNA polymerase sigma-70 factor (ECF subfamily)